MFTLYTKNDCVYCDIMKEKLKEWGVPHWIVNVPEDREGLAFLVTNGYKTVPQLIYNEVSLNDGIDTRLFTYEMLFDRIKSMPITPEIEAWLIL